jgi:hypothetical protein
MMPRKRGIIAVPAEAGTQPLHLPRERGLRLALTPLSLDGRGVGEISGDWRAEGFTPLSLDGRGVGERVALVAPHRPSPAGG